MLYAIFSEDVPESLPRRLQARPAHLERIQGLRAEGRLVLAGPHPALDTEDPGPAGFTGSLVVAEFPSLEAARAVAQLCLDGIEALALPHAGSCTASALTVSIGVASMLPVAGADPSMLVDAADAALYRAKKEGRNQFGLQPEAAA